jgi:hypothetical protein
MKKAEFVARHGDILVYKIDSIPAGLDKRKNNVLAYGEVTGHSHRVVVKTETGSLPSANIEFFEGADGNTYIRSPEPFHLDHEEHGLLGEIDPGDYVVYIKQEKDHMQDLVRRVVD